MNARFVLFSLLIFCLVFMPSAAVADPQIYLSADQLSRLNAGESEVEKLTEGLDIPNYPALDTVNKRFYWGINGKLFRCAFDGSNVETVFDSEDGIGGVTGIAVEPTSGYVFWTDYNANRIWKGKLDGSGTPEVLYTGVSGPVGIAVDPSTGMLYWGQQLNSRIVSGHMNGLVPKALVTATGSGVTGVAVDLTNEKLYWANFTDQTIERSDLDGGNREILFNNGDGVDSSAGISIDIANQLLYLTNANGKVLRGNADGSGGLTEVVDISSAVANLQGVQVTPSGSEIIFPGDRNIYKAAANGSGSPSVIVDNSNSFFNTVGIALDLANVRVFVGDLGPVKSTISSLDLEFTSPGVETNNRLLSGTIKELFDGVLAIGLVYDEANTRLIWAGGDKIQGGNADGTGSPADLFDAGDGLQDVRSLRYDPAGEKLYWTDQIAQAVYAGNADGSGAPTTLFDNGDGVLAPEGVDIDPTGGFIYWVDFAVPSILRGNIDGSGAPETLFSANDGVNLPMGLRLDLENGYIYFTDQGAGALVRGSIDGTGFLKKIVDLPGGNERIAIAQDDDSDGQPNGVDGCEDDAAKTEPGDCGCGQVDTDGNENGISDCLLNADTKDLIVSLRELVSSLKSTRTKSSKKNRKRRKAQKETIEMIVADMADINSAMTANIAQYNLVVPGTDLASLLSNAEKRVLKSRRTGSKRFKKFRKQALKALDALNSALAAS